MDIMVLPGKIELQTRMGNPIDNAQDPPFPLGARARALTLDQAAGQEYPGACRCRPPADHYNCHGLTFANRRTGIWRSDQIRIILADDGLEPVEASELREGDIAVYFEGPEISHTGVVLRVIDNGPEDGRRVWILSKWGILGEYAHFVGEDPYPECTVVYYGDRP